MNRRTKQDQSQARLSYGLQEGGRQGVNRILFIIKATMPKNFTRKEFNLAIRELSYTSHPDHYLKRLVERGKLKRDGNGLYSLV